ncbi:hypothetical protein HOLleu_34831 [Holothuria leucospilota]|uniref:EF-hand domain-containing protein n=1 Tax=Holothuria leucospilota TaxID=206669 RepID=A0A9Q0YSK0_HOLLE|nr:hypothetical protein HOLleu_34831 [Holothuria leucospilota]
MKMTRFLILAAIVALTIVHNDACTSSSGRTPAWDIGNNAEIYPTFSNGAVGVGVTIRFKRDTDAKREMFDLLDADSDGFISACEWIKEGGSVTNFVEFLNDDDTDYDEKISWEEFQSVTVKSQSDKQAPMNKKQ